MVIWWLLLVTRKRWLLLLLNCIPINQSLDNVYTLKIGLLKIQETLNNQLGQREIIVIIIIIIWLSITGKQTNHMLFSRDIIEIFLLVNQLIVGLIVFKYHHQYHQGKTIILLLLFFSYQTKGLSRLLQIKWWANFAW